MPDFQSIRLGPRIFELGRSTWLDLPFDLDEDPDTLQTMLSVLQSVGGQIQTQGGVPSSRLRLLMKAMDAESRMWIKRLMDRTLLPGDRIELVRDRGRYFWLAGDSDRDLEAGQKPASGSRYTMVSGDYNDPTGWLSVDLAHYNTRVNLIEDGDAKNGTEPWTNSTPSTLQIASVQYLTHNGQTGRCWEFTSKGTGAKTAKITFDLDGFTADLLPADSLTMSLKWKTTRAPGNALTAIDSVTIGVPGNHAEDVEFLTNQAPPNRWTSKVEIIDLATVTETDTSLELIIEFNDDLALSPVYISELQIEAGNWATGFKVYSPDRNISGARDDNDFVAFLNALAYRHQMPAWLDSETFGFTVGMTLSSNWDGAVSTPNSKTDVVIYNDCDNFDADSVPALKITTTVDTVTAEVQLNDGSSVTVSDTVGSWLPGVTKRILVSVKDGDGTTNSGIAKLIVNGVQQDSVQFDYRTIRQGTSFVLGTTPDGDDVAGMKYRDVVVAPVYIDGTTYTIDDFEGDQRPDRNSWRCVLDPAQKGGSDRVRDNQVDLDVMLIEHVTK